MTSVEDEVVGLLRNIRPEPVPGMDALVRRSADDGGGLLRSHAARRATRALAAVLLVTVTVAGGAAWRWLDRGTPSNSTAVACRSSTRPDAGTVALSFAEGSITDACRRLWDDGTFRGPAPESLVACVDENGANIVVPGHAGQCEALGFLRQGPVDELPGFVAFERRVVESLRDRCIDSAAALDEVQAKLDESVFAPAWTAVVALPTTPERPCAIPSFDVAEKTIVLGARRAATADGTSSG